jgi:hypothetical protein
MRGLLRLVLWLVAALLWCAVTGWCALACWFAPFGPSAWSGLAAAALVAGALLAVRLTRRWPTRLAALAALWGAVGAAFWWWPAPSNWDWQPDCSRAPEVSRAEGLVTVHGVRDFRWRSDTDFDARWEDRTYDPARLRRCDLFMSYWGPTEICHLILSFGFERPDGTMDFVAVSIEARRRVGQTYDALASAFRQFGLVYVWADERDVLRVRTDVRGEHVHRYRLEMPADRMRDLFDRYVAATQRLRSRPAWYNAITENCSVGIMRTAWGNAVPLFVPVQALLNGSLDRHAWDQGALDRSVPFEVLRARSDVTAAARGASAADFSQAIRADDVVARLLRPERIRPLGQDE